MSKYKTKLKIPKVIGDGSCTIETVFRAFMACSKELQECACDMIAVFDDPKATDHERQAAMDTLTDILFPPNRI